MILQDTYRLVNGVKIPKIGLGTWLIENGKAAQAVRDAIACGYRHIDTAQAYENEEGVGEGIRTGGVDRNDVFVTSKVAAEAKTYEAASLSINESLRKTGLSYIDMMIIHSPQPWMEFRENNNRYFEENREVWRALEDALKSGKVKAIGVSNFLQDDLENILSSCEIKPMVNQILCHIGNTPFELIEYCRNNGILVEAYSPVAHGQAMKDGAIIKMAEKYSVTVPQLCIRYDLQLGLIVLPKTANPKHMRDNANVDFEINEQDMEVLKKAEHIKNYGEHSFFPVFGGRLKDMMKNPEQ